MLIMAGLSTGLLAGLLGSGGVLIVPSLVLVGGLAIHRAIATSLPVIYAISVVAISSHLLGGQSVPIIVAAWFLAGGAVGLFAARRSAKTLPARVCKRFSPSHCSPWLRSFSREQSSNLVERESFRALLEGKKCAAFPMGCVAAFSRRSDG